MAVFVHNFGGFGGEYPRDMRLLVTGGAGYIGSHVVAVAEAAGHHVEVIDNLSTGLTSRLSCPVHQIDLASEASIRQLKVVLSQGFDSVIHLAAKKQVGESVKDPELYFKENLGGLANLLLAMKESNLKNLVFSSSAAAYGMPEISLVSETYPARPINPYGQTKLIGEWMVSNAKIWGLNSISLRYFNVAGSASKSLRDTAALNLIPIVINKVKAGEKPEVFGADYPTADGTCIRDYVHVSDLAQAHLKAVSYILESPIHEEILNIGTGTGSSVFEVLKEIRRVSGIDFEHVLAPRRAGDPAQLVADVSRAKQAMGFTARYSLSEIVETSWF